MGGGLRQVRCTHVVGPQRVASSWGRSRSRGSTPVLRKNSGTGEDVWVCWRLESGGVRRVSPAERGLNHSVPLPVGWRGKDGAGLQGKLRHVLGVFGHRWPYVSVLLVEELSV